MLDAVAGVEHSPLARSWVVTNAVVLSLSTDITEAISMFRGERLNSSCPACCLKIQGGYRGMERE